MLSSKQRSKLTFISILTEVPEMTLRTTDATDTHGLTMFPTELKTGGKIIKAACAEPTLESGDDK